MSTENSCDSPLRATKLEDEDFTGVDMFELHTQALERPNTPEPMSLGVAPPFSAGATSSCSEFHSLKSPASADMHTPACSGQEKMSIKSPFAMAGEKMDLDDDEQLPTFSSSTPGFCSPKASKKTTTPWAPSHGKTTAWSELEKVLKGRSCSLQSVQKAVEEDVRIFPFSDGTSPLQYVLRHRRNCTELIAFLLKFYSDEELAHIMTDLSDDRDEIFVITNGAKKEEQEEKGRSEQESNKNSESSSPRVFPESQSSKIEGKKGEKNPQVKLTALEAQRKALEEAWSHERGISAMSQALEAVLGARLFR